MITTYTINSAAGSTPLSVPSVVTCVAGPDCDYFEINYIIDNAGAYKDELDYDTDIKNYFLISIMVINIMASTSIIIMAMLEVGHKQYG